MMPFRLTGKALIAARIAAETPGPDAIVREVLRKGLGIDTLARLPHAWRGAIRLDIAPIRARDPRRWSDDQLPPPAPRAWPRTALTFATAYRDRLTTPRQVLDRALAALAELPDRRPTMNILAAKGLGATHGDADASTARHAAGAPLGPLDGVPFLVKDEFDVSGLPTRLGSRCEPDSPAPQDSTVVARLRRAGAIFAGKTVLTEWGMSPIGGNTGCVVPHNPHHPERAPGGSSTGSGVGVALGVAPIAAGGDGGGSIRIPAALNGVYGLKPTFGRVSRAGDRFLGSVAHAGPLGSSPLDLALFLDAVSTDPDPDDPNTSLAPPPPQGGFGARLGAGVRGLRIGVPDDEWQLASAPVERACREALDGLKREGAEIIPIRMPIARYAPPIGFVTIGTESLAANRQSWLEKRDLINDDVRLSFAALSGITALEMLDAQRLRSGLRREVAEILRQVDVIALPTTAITAPRYTEQDAIRGFSDPASIEGLCRYAFLANLTGLPAGTAPVGIDPEGLPIGLQIVGDAWDEPTVLAVLAHLERAELAQVRRPRGAIDIL